MTTLDLSPAPGAAPAGTRVWRQARTEAMLLVRNGEQLLLALVIPIGALVLGRLLGDRFGLDFALLVPSVLALAIWSSAFTSLAIATGFERRYGVLERLASTPLTRTGLLLGKAISLLLVTAGQLVLLMLVAFALGWRPVLQPLPVLIGVLATVLAGVAFAALALLLAGTLRAELTLGLANLIYLLLAVAGGVLLPLSGYPEAIRPVVAALPTAALAEALRGAGTGQAIWWSLPVLLVWAVAASLLTRKVFRWMS
ncbi:ABC-2 type transport system permease protein [Propionibacteriaceae bacterium ES.041]|uniref:ABC transporter permease n=1 Tax=Enemella evansiae TaxID=2016499 RepID=A0A255GGB0_9ACTN|nr:ABC transporter permease [Enemella evansiae]OYO14621.1 ABC transporter permease [Enemella evansiae]PFG67821.1 ABC-2 type transport system permease protein [Propionibacteriaceae bacterium ES.041]